MNKDFDTIICPYCKMEYLPSEIFIPNNFFGRPGDIERSGDGRIIQYTGTGMDLKEEYKCDCCGKTFFVSTQIKFNSTPTDPKNDFDEDYETPLKVKKYSLFED